MTVPFNSQAFDAFLMGDESLTIACGDMILAGGHRLSGVITCDATVRGWAKAKGVAVFEQPREILGAGIGADWLLSIANLRMIPADVLAVPGKGAVNFHDGPLPRYAGLNTPAWAVINGETSHGVSWHVIEGGVDEGDLLAQKTVAIAPDETAFSLNSKCYAAGMESFAAVLSQLEAGTLDRSPQDLSQRSYFARDQRPENMGLLDFAKSAAQLDSMVRGLDFGDYWNPLGRAKLAAGGAFYSVTALDLLADQTGGVGEVLSVSDDRVTVGTGTTAVTLRGLRSLEGGAVCVSDLFAVGDMLTAPDVPTLDLKDEGYWRAALTGAAPVQVPLVTVENGASMAERNGADMNRQPLSLPAGMSVQDQITVAMAVLLRGTEAGQGSFALKSSKLHPMAADWVPLQVRAVQDTDVKTLREAVAGQMERAATSAGMMRDLLSRDPDIAAQGRPPIGISLDADPVEGVALCLCLDGETAHLSYDPARLKDEAVGLICARIQSAATALATAQTCADLRSLPASEMALLEGWNDTERSYERTTIHAAFEAQVAQTPDSEAVVFEGESLSYAALNARANKLAHVLRDQGATPGTPIGLFTTRSLDLLIGALGILKAGGAYVPLDPAYPAERIAHYISDSAAPLIVTQAALAQQLPTHNAQVVALDADPRIAAAPDAPLAEAATADDLAYLIYTSGSTGTPKGVMVSHGNVANFFAGMDDRIDHDAGAVWLAVTSLSFDISVLELFWTLARGFKLVLAGDDSRTMVSNGPIAASDRKIDFNLMYWGNDDGVGPKKYELLLEGAKFADANGFNAVWTPERHFHAFGGPYPNPSVTGAAVAAVTQNLSVRAGSCVAPLHHPARIAEEWAVIDNLTNGRVGLAIASGWQPDDFVLRPENTPPANKPAMYAAIDQLRQMWRGTPVEFPKQDGTMHAVVTQPRPVSKELPVWVTTAGNPQTWKEAGEIGANVLTHLLGQSVDEVAGKIKIYHQALRDAGHDPADFTVTLMLHSYLAETRAQAEEVARGPMKDYLRSAAALIKQYAWAFPAFKRPEGTSNAFDLDLEGVSDEELDAILEFAFQRYFNDSGLFGTVADGVARVEQLKAIGVDEVACLIDYGIDPALVMEGLKPLAEVLHMSNQGTVLADDDFSLAAQIVRHKVSHLQCTPSMAQMLVTNDGARAALGQLQHLMVGGEALPGSLVGALKSATHASLQNMYGPTETTIWSTTQMIEDAATATAPIGTPIANTQTFIIDDKMCQQPVGVEGELWIGGDGVTQGYWQRPELSDERFVANPFGAGKLYCTGDLAAWDAQGRLHFAGRADAQVKIRGHRIELGEIEARMAELPGVSQAVVTTVNAFGGEHLVGYVTAQPPLDPEQTKAALSAVLPAIMVPGYYVTVDAMPLTPNKKIDRKALPLPRHRQTPRSETPSVPANATQATISEVWTRLLGVSDIRGEDNFFGLGGHSLLAVQAHRDIKTALGSDSLTITDIFRFPTLAGLAGHIDKGTGGAAPQVAASAQPVATEAISKRRAMRAGRSKSGA
ncbi:LLM class flavin-dependent oxidoreductase [Sulfitobacter sp. M57]|uniref:MupA/Atu3671 family FMN-dependent luciferase-like monooxygenase n=1 Tax=unclassified Sulfitobacter TaxID=196795 RepID=UPI0023E09DE2|nr:MULTISPECIES: MupA/Atu3671 family FMN-dependent luciferase-like monooxygenase [unclassified Sulfitobacter]MDF3414225.1 LLM class flavin-dependent oxidoreductase [Sulfitobacter sp. KE5]MDF3420493.1 LLM class flavin-dependent oxidoreductase [Sulfitobacter sp. KE43]MDF3432771.1 LLM class flavin-dependent oxidoreductase [Sulfitobacter sp. KE42]MDF3458411.1 LLM class flavin-dependent oxidoreductase [Sulfitobacter sp. S74]MDF3462311.1 LLM class flavin-dependent oxidoreductase [Sulfitobacter sp. K